MAPGSAARRPGQLSCVSKSGRQRDAYEASVRWVRLLAVSGSGDLFRGGVGGTAVRAPRYMFCLAGRGLWG